MSGHAARGSKMVRMRLVSLLLLGAMSQESMAQTYYARERI